MSVSAALGVERVPLTRQDWFVRALQVAVMLSFVAAWEGLGRAGVLDPFYYSRPSLFVPRIVEWFAPGSTAGDIWLDIRVSLAFDPLLSMFNAIPRLVLAPVFILAFGIDLASKVALGVTLVFFIVFFATFAAVRDVDQTLVDNVRILGARRRDVTFEVLLPAAFSAIVASLRTSAGFAFAGAVVAEYIGSNAGLGRRIATSEAFFDSTGVFGGIVLIALLALLLDSLLQLAEGRSSRWKPRRER